MNIYPRVGVVVGVIGLLGAYATAQAEPAALASGLEQLTRSFESHNPRLREQLRRHLTDAAGAPLVLVRLSGADPEAALRGLSAAGFRLQTRSSLNPALVEGYLPLAAVRAAAAVPGVKSLHATPRPAAHAGLVQSQAVALEHVDAAQARGLDGSGIRIGVLSDSYDECTTCSTHAAQDIASGDLPAAGVTVLQDELPSTIAVVGPATDEGRGMLQLVHDIAPGAQLGFASAFNGELSFAENILALRSLFHADVIVDDVGYSDEPMYSDGIVAQAVDIVSHSGAAYFSSAGNNGLEAYEAVYRPVAFADAQALVAAGGAKVHLEQIPADIRPQTVHDFRNADGSVAITQRFSSNFAGSLNTVSFQWDEPFFLNLVKTNFIVYVFDKDGNWMDPSGTNFPGLYSTDNNLLTDEPVQLLQIGAFPTDVVGGANVSDFQFVIGNVNGGPAQHIKYITINGLGVSERQNAPSTFGHPAARGGLGVAATYYAIPAFTEDFSSPGPLTIYTDSRGRRLPQPEVRFTPQITAADGVNTTFFGGIDPEGDGFPNFFGTSAAAPDAAAVAALVLQAAGGPRHLTPQQLYRRLERTATPIPLPNLRSVSAATAGPVHFDMSGDWVRWDRDFGLRVSGARGRSVSSITFDTTALGLAWNPNPNRFSVGAAEGVSISDMTHTVSADASSFSIGFAPKSFGSGDSFRFGMSVFAPIEGFTQEDPDRFRGMNVTVTLDDGAVLRSTVVAPPRQPINRWAGFGLVDAERATRFEEDD